MDKLAIKNITFEYQYLKKYLTNFTSVFYVADKTDVTIRLFYLLWVTLSY